MKFSFTTFSMPRSTLEQILATARELGYEGVEPRLDARHAHGIEVTTPAAGRQVIREQVQAAGISLACISTPCSFSNPATAAAQVDLCRRYIDLAADLGCGRIRVFGGEVPDGLQRDGSLQCLIDSLRALAPYARQRSVTVCLETHDAWCDTAIVAFVMDEVHHPGAGVVWDIMHTQRSGHATPEEAYRILRPYIRHVHVHDGLARTDVLRIVPTGTGDFDHSAILRSLRNDHYPGFVSGEWIESCMEPELFQGHLRRELQALRRLLAS
jgi:sugar phosphate isomerase/epimerase